MPNRPDWYEVTQGSTLLHGDLLSDCPRPRVRGLEQWPFLAGHLLEVDIAREDRVGLPHDTQAFASKGLVDG